jgi:rhodanese-related sulfurtransferase
MSGEADKKDGGASGREYEAILQAGAARGVRLGLPYAGAITPPEAFALVRAAPAAKIVDVRTRAEWQYVGRIPDAVEIEWQSWPEMNVNPRFAGQLAEAVAADAPVLFICRSGARSHHAALAAQAAGWTRAFNVLEGFEGDLNSAGHRNAANGWRFHGLPWMQS